MPLDFTAIDFETANGSPASPCAVGLVRVRDGVLVEGLASVFWPPAGYRFMSAANSRIHGIYESDLDGAPEFSEALEAMLGFIGSDVLIAHNAQFDMGVLRASAAAVNVQLPDLNYLCSLLMARKSYTLESYRLNSVAFAAGHEEFNHHDALADADACARIVLHMATKKHHVDNLEDLAAATKQSFKPLNVAVQTPPRDWA